MPERLLVIRRGDNTLSQEVHLGATESVNIISEPMGDHGERVVVQLSSNPDVVEVAKAAPADPVAAPTRPRKPAAKKAPAKKPKKK